MTSRYLPKAGLLLLAGGLALAACSSQPQPNAALTQARSSFSSASGNPEVARYGSYPLAEAQENLATAQQAWSNNEGDAKVTHYANLAQTQTEIASAMAKRRSVQAQTINAAREVTLGDMLFQVGKADLNPQGQQVVATLATFMKNNPDRNVTVIGHTDSTGSDKLNAKLSQDRANTVKTALIHQGVPAQRIAAIGRGPADPVASNATEEGRQENRRVVVDIGGPGATGMGSTSPTVPVVAAGSYDGTWQVNAAPAGNVSTSDVASCDGVQLQFQVKDNQIQGSLARAAYGGNRVTQTGRGQTPITGTVQPDGTVNARWQDYQATGKLTGDKAELHWQGQCGPRVATGGRVASGVSGSSAR